MPRAQRCAAESDVTSCPSNEIKPDEGGSVPAIRLNSVDFPAPLGPIRPRISPRWQFSDMSSLATTPLKRRDTLRTSSSGFILAPLAGTAEIRAREFGEGNEDCRPQCGPPQRPDASEHGRERHQQ